MPSPTKAGASGKPAIVSLVSLGCSKNTVDSECIIGTLVQGGLMIAENPAESDVCLVNTCGFIHDARQEAADVLEELRQLKAAGRPRAIVALGCLVERVAETPELNRFLAAADARVGFAEYPRLAEICRRLAAAPRAQAAEPVQPHPSIYRMDERFMGFLRNPRARVGSPHTAYLKISEGCSNLCRFCSIPRIRGLQVSRPMDDVLDEARALIEGGAREINLIAQDTTSYGRDLYGEQRLHRLLGELGRVDATIWYRMLYAYPRFLSPEILDAVSGMPHVCPYLDLPLQHIADRVLRDMGRGMDKRETVSLLDDIARRMPHGALRTTFIVGYPGETEAEFEEVMALVREKRFTHVGVFTYSSEPGTPAAKMPDDVPESVKQARRDAIMQAQLEVSRARLREKVGSMAEVMLDGHIGDAESLPEGVTAFGRTRLEAPEVDGMVLLRGNLREAAPGDRVKALVTDALDYDLIADAT